MEYTEARAYLDQVTRRGIKYDLANIRRLLHALGHPERGYPVVCVCGTNGKGSVCAFLESILAEAGYRAGMNTSPHLVTPRERVRINRERIGKAEFAAAIGEVRDASLAGWRDDDPGRPTFFETITAAALVYFRARKVDVAILEAGLGGRLDGTNACRPLLSVVTRIAVDHSKTLGGTTAKIAFEKMGLARSGRPVLFAPQRPAVLARLRSIAEFRGAIPLEVDCRWSGSEEGLVLSTSRTDYIDLGLSLAGRFQKENAATAVRAAEILGSHGFDVTPDAVRRGLAGAYWPGRMELRIIDGRRVLMDSSHNPDGIRQFTRELKRIPAGRRILIYGTMADKRIKPIVRALFPLADTILLPALPQARAADPARIRSLAGTLAGRVAVARDAAEAWRWARELAEDGDLIVVVGSLYLVGEFKAVTGEQDS